MKRPDGPLLKTVICQVFFTSLSRLFSIQTVVFQKQTGFIQQKIPAIRRQLLIVVEQPFDSPVAGSLCAAGIVTVTDQIVNRYLEIIREQGQGEKIRFPITVGIPA